jgi:hypothetical protein
MVTRRKSTPSFMVEISADGVGLSVRDLGVRQGVRHTIPCNDAFSRTLSTKVTLANA